MVSKSAALQLSNEVGQASSLAWQASSLTCAMVTDGPYPAEVTDGPYPAEVTVAPAP